jgi:hypothetical protein
MYRKKYRDLYFCKTTAEPIGVKHEADLPATFYLFGIKRILPMKRRRICKEMRASRKFSIASCEAEPTPRRELSSPAFFRVWPPSFSIL